MSRLTGHTYAVTRAQALRSTREFLAACLERRQSGYPDSSALALTRIARFVSVDVAGSWGYAAMPYASQRRRPCCPLVAVWTSAGCRPNASLPEANPGRAVPRHPVAFQRWHIPMPTLRYTSVSAAYRHAPTRFGGLRVSRCPLCICPRSSMPRRYVGGRT